VASPALDGSIGRRPGDALATVHPAVHDVRMGLTIGDLFRRNSASAPSSVAASLGDVELTYREIDLAANRMVRALREVGIAVGDRVMWWGETTLDAVPLFAALAKLGAVFAPLNARYGPDEAVDVAQLARSKLLVADPPHIEAAMAVAQRVGALPVALLDDAG